MVPRMAETDLLFPATDSTPTAEKQDQTLPSNVEAEAAFLGAVLIDNQVVQELNTPLQPHHFYEPVHQRIYERIHKLIDRNSVATPVTLKPYFESDEAMKQLGGVTYLAQLTMDGQGLLATGKLAEQIYDLALLRELVHVGRNLVEGALDTSDEVAPMDRISQAEADLYKVAEGATTGSEAQDFRTAALGALKMVEAAINSGGKFSGKTTGLETINDKTSGLHNSDLVILAGRPGMGKTSLATNIAFNAARRLMDDEKIGIERGESPGAATAFFSLEMSADQLATRILAETAEISSEKLRSGKLSKEEFQRLSFASQELNELPLYIDDTPGLTIGALRTRARRLKRRHDIGLIIVDYLQLLQGSGRANDNRVNEISEISRGLKTLAKELHVPVIALSQLSRAVEQREDKRPQLSDLRESGSIEQDADMVWFIYRGEYYHNALKPDTPDETSSEEARMKYADWEARHLELVNRATLIVAKQRHGSTGNVPLLFQSEFTKFTSPELRGGYEDYE